MTYEILNILEEIKTSITNNIANRWLNIDDVCIYSGLSKSTIFRAIQKGELKVSKQTGRNLFRKVWIDNFLGE